MPSRIFGECGGGQPSGLNLVAGLPSSRLARWRSSRLPSCPAARSFDDAAVLRAEMARKNMYFKDADNGAAKRPRHVPSATPGYEQYYPGYGGYPPPAAAHASTFQQVSNTKDNPPCNTLFIGNLGDNTSEAELRAMFCHMPVRPPPSAMAPCSLSP